MNELIENLAREKSFAALSADERQAVLSELSPGEYEQLRALLQAARRMDAALPAPPDLKSKLARQMAAAAQRERLRGQVFGLVGRRIPAWQAAAAALLGMAAVHFLQPAPPPLPAETVVQIVEKRDTIWAERTRWRERIAWRERPAATERASTLPDAAPQCWAQSPSLPLFLETPAVPVADSAFAPLGSPLSDSPELLDFFVRVER